MSEQIARPFACVVLVVLMSGPNLAMPTNPARAADCRSAPNSPAPAGTHWYYRLDWETQRKCWYVRASGRRAHQATTLATIVPTTASHAAPAPSDPTPVADARPMSPSPGDTTPPSPQAETSALKAISAPVSGGTIDKTPRQSALEESSTPSEEASTPASRHLTRSGRADGCIAYGGGARSTDIGYLDQDSGIRSPDPVLART